MQISEVTSTFAQCPSLVAQKDINNTRPPPPKNRGKNKKKHIKAEKTK